MLPCEDMRYGNDSFLFQQELKPTHSAKTATKRFVDHDFTLFYKQNNSTYTESTGVLSGRRMSNIKRAEGWYQAVPQADHLHATPL